MKPADTRIELGSRVKLSKWDANDAGVIGNGNFDAGEWLDRYRAKLETLRAQLYVDAVMA